MLLLPFYQRVSLKRVHYVTQKSNIYTESTERAREFSYIFSPFWKTKICALISVLIELWSGSEANTQYFGIHRATFVRDSQRYKWKTYTERDREKESYRDRIRQKASREINVKKYLIKNNREPIKNAFFFILRLIFVRQLFFDILVNLRWEWIYQELNLFSVMQTTTKNSKIKARFAWISIE